MASLQATHQDVATVLDEEGYQFSDDGSFEVQLYDQRNIIASTEPSLLAGDYATRMELMSDINEKLAMKIRKKRQRLAMLLNNTPAAPGASTPRRSARLQNKKKTHKDDYWYY